VKRVHTTWNFKCTEGLLQAVEINQINMIRKRWFCVSENACCSL